MGKRVYFNGKKDNVVENVAYEVELNDDLTRHFEVSTFVIVFKNSAGEIVTPTDGLVEIFFSPVKGQLYQPHVGRYNFPASTAGIIATYTQPTFIGPVDAAVMRIENVVGADYFEAFIWRGNNIKLSGGDIASHKYESLTQARMDVTNINSVELATSEGKRYYMEYDRVFANNETQYFSFDMPTSADGLIAAFQNRDFKSFTGPAEIEIIWDPTNVVRGTQINTWNENQLFGKQVNQSGLKIYEADSFDGGISRENDFISNDSPSSGGVSDAVGYRLYAPDEVAIVRVSNLDNVAQRIHLSYSWIEIPDTFFTPMY